MLKYRKITQDLYGDNILIKLLEEEARNGWILRRIHYFYLEFESIVPTALKYQIDHLELTSEYNIVIESLGYKRIKGVSNRNIYVTDNLDAEDLYNDEDTKVISYLNHYKLSKIFKNLIYIFIGIQFCDVAFLGLFFSFYRHSLSQFLLTTSHYLVFGLGLLLIVYYTINMISMIYKRKYFQNILKTDIYDINKTNKILYKEQYMNIIESIILLLSSISLIVYCFISKHSIVLLLTFLCGAIVLTIQLFFKKNKYHRIVQVSIILICLLLGYFNLSSPINKVSKKLYYENKTENQFLYENKEIFASQKMIHIFNDDYYENHITALNDTIAKEIFKEEVIRLECYSRGGSHVTENFYHTFDKAIANMKILDLPIIDKGFYNDQYVICIKDNEVVSFRIADVDKEEVIQYYFK